MVNPSTYSMVSTLAGLQRLEAQISQALMRAGAPAQIQALDPTDHKALQTEAEKSIAAAGAVVGMPRLDFNA